MNATGDSDFRWFYAKIRAEQTTVLVPKIRRVVDIWLRTKAGRLLVKKKPDAIAVTFPSLWSETPVAEASRRYSIAQADALYIANEVYLPEEVALSRSRPEGYDGDVIQLTDDARTSRENLLKNDLPKLVKGTLNPDPAAAAKGAPPGGAPTQKLDEQDRAENGQFGSGGGHGAKMVDEVLAKGGVTTHPNAAQPTPTSGIMVSRAVEEKLGHVIDIQAMANADPPPTASELHAQVSAEANAWLDKALPAAVALGPDHYIGGWAEKDKSGDIKAIHLDVSQRFDKGDREKAISAGRERNQVSVWDLDNAQEISTGGTGR
jgi:hypothetical protein